MIYTDHHRTKFSIIHNWIQRREPLSGLCAGFFVFSRDEYKKTEKNDRRESFFFLRLKTLWEILFMSKRRNREREVKTKCKFNGDEPMHTNTSRHKHQLGQGRPRRISFYWKSQTGTRALQKKNPNHEHCKVCYIEIEIRKSRNRRKSSLIYFFGAHTTEAWVASVVKNISMHKMVAHKNHEMKWNIIKQASPSFFLVQLV